MNRRANYSSLLLSVFTVAGLCAIGSAVEAKPLRIPPGQSLLVMSKSGSNSAQFQKRLEKRGFIINREIKCQKEGWSIFEVRSSSGVSPKRGLQTLTSAPDPEMAAAEVKFPSKSQACTPSINDPSFPTQINLQTINFTEMRCLLDAKGISQVVQPRITFIDSGITPVANEFTDIHQYSFVDAAGGVSEAPFDTGVHGTAVASVAVSATNNNLYIAGVASHTNKVVKITMLRVNDNLGAIDTVDVLDAMRWCIDHQSDRGGPGVISMSISAFGLPTYNGSPVVQEICKSLLKNDDLFVNAAGNEALVDLSKEKNLRRIAGIDQSTELLWSNSNRGPYFNAASPAVLVPAYDNTIPQISQGTGTSFAAPHWSGSIALLMSLDPKLTAKKADAIIYKTGRETSQGYIVPDLRKAVIKALKIKP